MPYKTDKDALNDPFLDRRTKLIPCKKEMVKFWYEKGMSISSIARLFKVSKRTIQFILFPERQQKNLEDRKERGGTMAYYNKDEHKESMKNHRQYKYNTLKDITEEVVRDVLKEELSKRDRLKAKLREVYLEGLSEGNPSIARIMDMGFEYPEVLKDLTEIAIEWGNEGIQRMRSMKPTSEAEAAFIKMFDGMYADVWFEKHPDSIYFFKGDPSSSEYWFELEGLDIWCDYDLVWEVFSDKYSLKYAEKQNLIKPLVEEAFRMSGVSPWPLKATLGQWWKRPSE